MVSCSDLSIQEISGGKVYLQGTITGLDNNKEYCLAYYESYGVWKNAPNKSYDYTYVPNRTSLNTGDAGVWLPEESYTDAGRYYVAMYEVSGTCENIVEQVCSKYVDLNPDPCQIDFVVLDTNFDPIDGCKCHVGGKSATTGGDGMCSIEVECGKSYTATCDVPDGYSCGCNVCKCSDGPFTPHNSGLVEFTLLKDLPKKIIIHAPATATQFEEFPVDVEFAPNTTIEIHREIPFFKDTVIGKRIIQSDGKDTIQCITNVSGEINIYGCYKPGLTKCEVESDRSKVEVDKSIIDFKIESPETVTAGQPFAVDIYFKPDRLVTLVVKSAISYVVISSGTTDSDGHVQVGATIHNTGVREIWAISEKGLTMDESNHVDVDVISGDTDEKAITLDIPGIVMAGDIDVSGTVIGSELVKIMAVQSWWGMMNDKLLGSIQSGEDGKFKTTVKIDDFGYYSVYAKVDQSTTDWVSDKESVIVLTWTIILALALAVGMVLEKRYNRLGIFTGGKR